MTKGIPAKVKEIPEFLAEIKDNYSAKQVSDNYIELTFDQFKPKILKKFPGIKASLDIYLDIYKKHSLNVSIDFNGNSVKVENIYKEDDKVKILIKGKINKLQSLAINKIKLKARVPVAQTVKAAGDVRYTTKNPFTFTIYEWYALPNIDTTWNANGTLSLVNKGAIFWYPPTDTATNIILGFNYILVNIPSTEFISSSQGTINLNNSNVYFGWYNPSTTYPKQYVDFYVYQSQMNNYLYKFTVKKSTFFTNVNFPNVKDVTIS